MEMSRTPTADRVHCMSNPTDVADFLVRVGERGPGFGLSEAKQHRVASGARELVTVREEEAIVAVGVAAPHRQPDGGTHWSVETTVRPDMAFPEFEAAVLEQTLALVPGGRSLSVWSGRPTLNEALDRLGFAPTRSLLHMTVALPLTTPAASTATTRAMRPEDVDAILDVNRRAFADHREAAELDREGFEALATEDWFEPGGLLVAEVDAQVVGFCWTKVHRDGEGEIYRIAVSPDHHGLGIGRRLVTEGFGHLANRDDVAYGGLWVDADNVSAVRLYESIGMETDRTNTEFERLQPKR